MQTPFAMSHSLPSLAMPVQGPLRSSAMRGRTSSLSFLLVVLFIVLFSIKLISDEASQKSHHSLEKRQFQVGALFGSALQQVRDPNYSCVLVTLNCSHICWSRLKLKQPRSLKSNRCGHRSRNQLIAMIYRWKNPPTLLLSQTPVQTQP